MIAQISSPVRALILLFTLIGSLYIFHPYTPSRSSFSLMNPQTTNPTATVVLQEAPPAKTPQIASPPATKLPADTPPEVAQSHVSADVAHDPDEGGPSVRQATMIYESEQFNDVYERSVDTHARHGERWGVPTHILRHDIVEAGFFNKPAYILGLIIEEMAKPSDKRAGWIVWFDADTLILNPAVSWTLFLPPPDFDDIHLLATQDQNGFNAGMAIFRVHEWSVRMLTQTLALRELRPDVHFEFYDQGALKWVMEREGYAEHVMYQPHNWWNSFGLNQQPYETDAFMLHFAGADCCGQEDSKGTVMDRWLDILENKPQQYAMELEKTKLPKDVKDYWALLRKAKKTIGDLREADDVPRELQIAQNDLWASYSYHADNATEVSMALQKVENIMANAKDKVKQKAPATKEGESAKKEGESAKKEGKPGKKEEVAAKKEEAATKKEAVSAQKEVVAAKKEEVASKQEAVEASKKAAQAKEEAAAAKKEEAAAKKEPGPPAKNNR